MTRQDKKKISEDKSNNEIDFSKEVERLKGRVIDKNHPDYELYKRLAEQGAGYIIPPDEEGEIIVKNVFTSGLLDDDKTFFHVVFISKDGHYNPLALTSKKEELPILDNEIELLKNGVPKKDISEEDKYFFFNYGNTKYKIITDLFFRDTYRINTVSNGVLKTLKDGTVSKDVYDKYIGKFKEYYDHSNILEYDIINTSTIDTYLLRVIRKTFYVILQGKEDTGKSTLQKTMAKLQYNGLFGGKGTIPVNVRLAHYLGCNINQDEFDKMFKEEKKIFAGVANSGLYADGTYSLIDVNKKRLKDQITILFTFSKKTFSTNNLHQFDKSFLSRCYILITVRQGRQLKDINDLTEKDEQEFQNLRNEMFVYCLLNALKIKEDIVSVKEELEEEGVFGRKTDMNSIILGVIKHFKGEHYLNVKEYLKEKEGLTNIEKSNTKEGLTFEFIASQFISERKVVEIYNREIVDYVTNELSLNEEERKSLSKSIGWILKNYSLIQKGAHIRKGERGNVKYIIEKDIFLDMLKRFQYKELLNKLTENPAVETVKTVETVNPENVSTISTLSTDRMPEPSDKDLIVFVEERGDSGYPTVEFIEKYGEDKLKSLLERGELFENPRGILRVLK